MILETMLIARMPPPLYLNFPWLFSNDFDMIVDFKLLKSVDEFSAGSLRGFSAVALRVLSWFSSDCRLVVDGFSAGSQRVLGWFSRGSRSLFGKHSRLALGGFSADSRLFLGGFCAALDRPYGIRKLRNCSDVIATAIGPCL